MPVDPFLEPLLANVPHLLDEIDDFPAFRAQHHQQVDALADQLAEPGPEVKERRSVTIPAAGATVGLRIYQPPADGPHPAHLYLHGGGWIAGSPWDKFTDIIWRPSSVTWRPSWASAGQRGVGTQWQQCTRRWPATEGSGC